MPSLLHKICTEPCIDLLGRDYQQTARLVSRLLGWTYFSLWSLSFYPQVVHHIRRRSTHGFSLDFSVANIVGLACYAMSNTLLLYSPAVRDEYAIRHPDAPEPAAAFNDLAYGVHGTLLMVVVLSQFVPSIWGFDLGRKARRPSPAMLAICGTSILLVLLSVACVGSRQSLTEPSRPWAWLDVADTLATVKVMLTAIKYTPQAWTMYRLKSTAGFNMIAVMMDFVGALLSLVQLGIDAAIVGGGDWSSVTNNPGKFGLGNVSLAFDVIFLWQHYVLYPDSWRNETGRQEVAIVAEDAHNGHVRKDNEVMAASAAVDEQTPLLGAPRGSPV